jgi:hypothetical protein
METISVDTLANDFVKNLIEGSAALFVGAGLSRAEGFVDWKGLLAHIAKDLGLEIDQETDMVAIAQYHHNKYDRSKLDQLIIDEFTKDIHFGENHELIADLPIHTVWTTNYDELLEKAFQKANKRCDVKRTEKNLATTMPGRAVTLYKMHGDVSQPDKAVLTKDDYETFELERALFSTMLKGDLVNKTFLFLGYSFSDPNIDYILSRIRSLLGKNQRQHYCVMRIPSAPKGLKGKEKAKWEYDQTKLDLRISDLKRYSIYPVLIKEYSDITTILRRLGAACHLRDVFVSGSADDFAPLGEPRIKAITEGLGTELIKQGLNIVSGFGVGIGSYAIVGAMKELGTNDEDRLVLRPFPQNQRAAYWTDYRTKLISKSGFCVFLCGNKRDKKSKKIVQADGVIEEFKIAQSLGKIPIPIGATGHAAAVIWREVTKSLAKFFPNPAVAKEMKTLGDAKSSDGELVDAVVSIIKKNGLH